MTIEQFKKLVEGNLFWVALVTFALLCARFVYEFARSYRLLKEREGGNAFSAIGELLATYIHSIELIDPGSWISWGLYEDVRRRVEYEAIAPRSEAKNMKRWRAGLKLARHKKKPLLRAETSKEVASAEERIRRYFELVNRPLGFGDLIWWVLGFGLLGYAGYYFHGQIKDAELQNALVYVGAVYFGFLAALTVVTLLALPGTLRRMAKGADKDNGAEAAPDEKEEKEAAETTEFLLKLEVVDAFIAPLHLIAGLLNRVGNEWQEILKVYKDDMVAEEAKYAGASTPWRQALKAVRPIQKFTFDCWLLWGPSIPICDDKKCKRHQGSMSSIQLGYGDENSSIEIIGDHQTITTTVGALAARRNGSELSVNVTTTGWISHSHWYPKVNRVSAAIQDSWEADENGRVLLLVQKGEEKGAIDPIADPGHYYTAYLWACFVIMRDKDGEPMPISSSDAVPRGHEPWLDYLPFFEHGNIADHTTYRFLKRQLARKALGGLSRLVKEWKEANPDKDYPLKFAYACAIDDSGCGGDVKFSRQDDNGDVKLIMQGMLKDEYPELNGVVLLDRYAADATNPHASCTMPDTIWEFYNHVAVVNRKPVRVRKRKRGQPAAPTALAGSVSAP